MKAIVFTAALLLSGAVHAQISMSPGIGGWGLTAGDINRAEAAAARLLNERSVGTVERWRNPETKTTGSVRLIRRYREQGRQCVRLGYAVHTADTPRLKQHRANWCNFDGEWKMVAQ